MAVLRAALAKFLSPGAPNSEAAWQEALKSIANANGRRTLYPPGVMLEAAGMDKEHWTAPHNDSGLWSLQLADAFGTRPRAVVATFMAQLEALCAPNHWDEEAKQWRLDENQFSAALAIVNSLKPRNEMEAALAAQMVAIHLLTMKASARALQYDGDTRTAATSAKLARAFTGQLEALQSLRRRSRTARQSITVKKEVHQHVYYHGGRRKVTANPMNEPRPLLTTAPLCQARNRAGKPCRCPAMRGKRVCMFHGGRAGAPKGERNGAFKHGGSTQEAVALRRAAQALLREIAGA